MEPKTSWCFMFLLAGAVSERERVIYSDPVCGVKGSTVTLLCTFTPLKPVTEGEGEVLVEIDRVVWCQNHEICQGSTPTVYDNKLLFNNPNNPRYRYLGDTKGNCSLQISDLQEEDDATLRFRMEGELLVYTGRVGVKVTVADGTQMKILSSRDGEFKRGEAVTLTCSTECTFHQLEVTWFRDGHALPYTGPSLHLGHLKAKDSGNYTCGLKNTVGKLSQPFNLRVEAGEEEQSKQAGGVGTLLAVRLVLFSLHTVLIIIVATIVIRRTCVCKKAEQPPDFMEEL